VPSVRHKDQWVKNPTPQVIEKAQRREDGFYIDLSELDARVAAVCNDLKEKFPECLRYTKTQVNFWKQLAWDQTVGHAQDWLSLHFASREPFEGMRAFVEKRRPDYKGIRAALAAGQAPELLHGAPSKICPACGLVGLPETFEFCGKCGVRLDAVEVKA
jgi:hypothetical protein